MENRLCKDCEHFKILYEPIRTNGRIWDFGRAICDKHDLITDFANHKKFDHLYCQESEVDMSEFELKEYTEEEYEADMRKLMSEKGLKGAVKEFCDKINDEAKALSYSPHRTIQEYLCDILWLIEESEVET